MRRKKSESIPSLERRMFSPQEVAVMFGWEYTTLFKKYAKHPIYRPVTLRDSRDKRYTRHHVDLLESVLLEEMTEDEAYNALQNGRQSYAYKQLELLVAVKE